MTSDLFGADEAGRPASGYWRPWIQLTYALEARLFGHVAWPYHLHNVLLHAANALLLLGLARRLGAPLGLALPFALLFGVHPVHVESLAPVSGRTDPYALFFCLLALRALLDGREPRALLFALLAVAAKESAILWLPLVAVVGSVGRVEPRRLALRLTAAAAVGAAFWFVARRVLDISAPPDAWTGEGDLLRRGLTFFAALPTYGRLLVFPGDVSLAHYTPLVQRATDPRLLAGAALALCLLWIATSSRRVTALGAWILILGLLPASNLVPVVYAYREMPFPVFERYLYAPSVGACLLAALLAARGLQARSVPVRRAAAGAVALVALAGVAQSARASSRFHDDLTLYRHAARSAAGAPVSVTFARQAAWAAFRAGRPADALQILEDLRARNPADAKSGAAAVTILAVLAQDAKARAEAHARAGLADAARGWREIADRLIEKGRGWLETYADRVDREPALLEAAGLLALAAEDWIEAGRRLRRAWETGRASPAAAENLRRVVQAVRRERKRRAEAGIVALPAARVFAERAIRALTGSFPPRRLPDPAREELVLLLCEYADDLVLAGRDAQAEAEYRRILSFAPDTSRAHEGLAYLLKKRGRRAEAYEHLERALALEPDAFYALNEMYSMLLEEGRKEEAGRYLARIQDLLRRKAAPRSPAFVTPSPAAVESGKGSD